LRKILQSEDGIKLPENEVERLIKEVDFNNDDKIDYNEFLDMMRKDLKGEATEAAVK
jgi:Ca2+-binding EF-hand superfamily protein